MEQRHHSLLTSLTYKSLCFGFVLSTSLSAIAYGQSKNSADSNDAPFTLPNLPKNEAGTKGKPKVISLPLVMAAPAEKLSAFLGQTIELNARVIHSNKASTEPFFYAWILNGKTVCKQLQCEIVLDGKTVKPGTYSLIFVAYNSQGSQRTSHILKVVQGKWKAGDALIEKNKKKFSLIPYRSEAVNYDKKKLWAENTHGNAVISYPGSVKLYGKVPRNINWYGIIRTSNNGVYHIVEPGQTEWFFTDQSVAEMKKSDNNAERLTHLRQGGVRLFLGDRLSEEKSERKTPTFTNNRIVSTPELSVVPLSSSDIYIQRMPANKLSDNFKKQLTEELKDKNVTVVSVISGQARVHFEQDKVKKNIDVTPGIQLVMFEGGTALPLGKPDPKEIEELYKITFSPSQAAKQKSSLEAAKKIDLAAHLKKVEELLDREDYFEALSEISLVEPRAQEDWHIPYYTGVAKKGLYQSTEAEASLKQAAKQNPESPLPYWTRAQMKMEEKKWADASELFDEAKARMTTDDKHYSEYYYYSGVASFQAEQSFSARSQFTRALWETQLENSLKASSGTFLGQLSKQKPWSVIVPVGIQYDQNALSLGGSDSIPDGYTSKTAMRAIAGVIFNYDTYPSATKNGLYWGAGAKAITIQNLKSEYSDQNAIVAGASATQTIRTQTADPNVKDSVDEYYTLTQGIDVLLLGKSNKHFQDTFNLGLGYKKYTFGLSYERDAQSTSDSNSSAILLKQEYSYVPPIQGMDVALSLEERYAFKKSGSSGHGATLNVTPGYTQTISMRQNIKYTLLLGYKYWLTDPSTSEMKVNPTVTYSFFITPWLLTTVAGNYEFTRQSISETKNISKPGASLMLIGLF